ncbi:MAG: ABC-F family ATP-binding cassette domain-containing protein [Clostridiales bacterium]|nr:ABC-F family ATP-binding cassette domain-containing protein [Clostridiales bacterium]
MPILTLNNITMNYGERRILDGVSFRVNKGDRIAFIGDNGAGKSTLFKIIKGTLTPDDGEVILHGNTIAGYLSQNMDEQDLSGATLKPSNLIELELKIESVTGKISRASDNGEDVSSLAHELSDLQSQYEAAGGYDYEYRLKDALAGLGLSDIHGRDDFTDLSGGEKMRVCLARLIVDRPDILLLDEPTNHLDMEAVEWLEKYLSSYGGAVFVITHDRHFIDQVATKVIELDGGHITEYKGGYTDYKEQKEHFIKSQSLVTKALEEELERQLDVKQTMLSHRNISGYHQREKMVAKLEEQLEAARAKLPSSYAKMSFTAQPLERTGRSDRIILQAKDLAMKFEDSENNLFDALSFEVTADEKLFLAGPNGCGKTTLLKLLSGHAGEKLKGSSGTVLIGSAQSMGYMEQFVPFDDESLTCFDELVSRSDIQTTEARTLLARFGFKGDDAFKKINMLSGGERSRLYLCCLLRENPDILFLDEPTNHLDINSREILEDAIKEYSGAVVCVSHDRFFIDKCADKILGFNNRTASLYDSYYYYRKAVQTTSETIVEAEEPKQENENTVRNANRAQGRKEAAKRRQRISDIEKETTKLEAEQKELEAKFSGSCDEADIKRYGEIAELLSKLYDEYFELNEE